MMAGHFSFISQHQLKFGGVSREWLESCKPDLSSVEEEISTIRDSVEKTTRPGLSGAEEMTTSPGLSSLEEMPSLSSLEEMPGLSRVKTGLNNVKEMSNVKERTGLISVEMPSLSSLEEMSGLSNMKEMTGLNSVKEMTGLSSLEEMTDLSNMKEMSSVKEMTSLDSLESFEEIQGLSNVPGRNGLARPGRNGLARPGHRIVEEGLSRVEMDCAEEMVDMESEDVAKRARKTEMR